MNRSKTPGTSQYRGVSWHKREQKWQAAICLGSGSGPGKQVHLGSFSSELEAARAYAAAAKQHFGDRANLNVPDNSQ